jgi:hypothetical protein
MTMNILTAGLGLLIAGFGALIAYFQWRTGHQRVVLDLFDRRVAVFRQIEDAAKGMLNTASRADMEAPFWSYIRAESDARFLFGEDVIETLAKRREDIAAVMAFSELDHSHPEWQQLNDRKYTALQNLAAFVQNSSPIFAPYMRLDQKMPSLWWPSSFRR